MIFVPAVPGGGRRWAAATCYWEHCTLLVPWKNRGSSPQANQTILTAGQLPSSAMLSFHLCLSVSVCPFLCASFTQPPPQSFLINQWCDSTAEEHLRRSTPLATNIYCGVLIYSGLISES